MSMKHLKGQRTSRQIGLSDYNKSFFRTLQRQDFKRVYIGPRPPKWALTYLKVYSTKLFLLPSPLRRNCAETIRKIKSTTTTINNQPWSVSSPFSASFNSLQFPTLGCTQWPGKGWSKIHYTLFYKTLHSSSGKPPLGCPYYFTNIVQNSETGYKPVKGGYENSLNAVVNPKVAGIANLLPCLRNSYELQHASALYSHFASSHRR